MFFLKSYTKRIQKVKKTCELSDRQEVNNRIISTRTRSSLSAFCEKWMIFKRGRFEENFKNGETALHK